MYNSSCLKSSVQGLIFFGLLFLSFPAMAAEPSFTVYPVKNEIKMNAGEHIIRTLYIKNNLGYDADFKIEVEDIAGSLKPTESIQIFGALPGPYSIKKYIFISDDTIFVKSGQTASVPVLISLPGTVRPGGLYGGVFISEIKETGGATTRVSTRIGSLFFLTIKGKVAESGSLKAFNVIGGNKIFDSRPVVFQTVFENTGGIYLNPYGYIEIKNRRGDIIDRLTIDPWYVLPESVRNRQLTWGRAPAFGKFTAELKLNNGYQNKISSGTYVFYVFPLYLIFKIIGLIVVVGVILKVVVRLRR